MSKLLREEISCCFRKRYDDFLKGYRQNLGLLGRAGVGKTRFLHSFYQALINDAKVLPVYVRAESTGGESLILQWMGSIAASVCSKKFLDGGRSISELIDEAAKRIPETTQSMRLIRRYLRQNKSGSAVRELFSLTGKLAEETGKKVVLMIDEFHEMVKMPSQDPFAYFGKAIMVEKNTLFVVASSSQDAAKEILDEKLDLLFSNFEVLEFCPLGFYETSKYLDERLGGDRLRTYCKRFLFMLTDGEPLYLDILADRLLSYSSCADGKVDLPHLMDAVCREFFDRTGRLSLTFDKRLEKCRHMHKDGDLAVRVLMALSMAKTKPVQVASSLSIRVDECKKILAKLCEEGWVRRFGVIYHIHDVAFRFWIREVFMRKQSLFIPAYEPLRRHFQKQLKEILEASEEKTRQDFYVQIEKMLRQFRGDRMVIDERKLSCPCFDEVQWREGKAGHLFLYGKSPAARWVIQPHFRQIQEESVQTFADDIKRLRRVKKRILVALEGIDQNAKLLASEHKIELWDLRFLNRMLDLYGQPKWILDYHPASASEVNQNQSPVPENSNNEGALTPSGVHAVNGVR